VPWGTFVDKDWSSPPVLLADTFYQRWKGLRPRPAGQGLLIRARSVHGFGMKEPLLIVGLDALGGVLGIRILFPRRFAFVPGARQILELPIDVEVPAEGAVLTWVGGGPTDSLRNTHRQSP
jgi:hypothetical protein